MEKGAMAACIASFLNKKRQIQNNYYTVFDTLMSTCLNYQTIYRDSRKSNQCGFRQAIFGTICRYQPT